jgi:hypothetical protein
MADVWLCPVRSPPKPARRSGRDTGQQGATQAGSRHGGAEFATAPALQTSRHCAPSWLPPILTSARDVAGIIGKISPN